eukprot:4519805-Prymnesium_polylepis.1
MDPSRAPPGSGTNLNSTFNSTPDDSSPAHHTTTDAPFCTSATRPRQPPAPPWPAPPRPRARPSATRPRQPALP